MEAELDKDNAMPGTMRVREKKEERGNCTPALTGPEESRRVSEILERGYPATLTTQCFSILSDAQYTSSECNHYYALYTLSGMKGLRQ